MKLNMKGQGMTEYVVILAVVVAVILIVKNNLFQTGGPLQQKVTEIVQSIR